MLPVVVRMRFLFVGLSKNLINLKQRFGRIMNYLSLGQAITFHAKKIRIYVMLVARRRLMLTSIRLKSGQTVIRPRSFLQMITKDLLFGDALLKLNRYVVYRLRLLKKRTAPCAG